MSAFDGDFATAMTPALIERYGVVITYNPHGGEGVATSGIFALNAVLPGYMPDGERIEATAVLRVDPEIVTSFSTRDTVTVAGETWAVDTLGESTPLQELQLVKFVRVAVGKGHRRER